MPQVVSFDRFNSSPGEEEHEIRLQVNRPSRGSRPRAFQSAFSTPEQARKVRRTNSMTRAPSNTESSIHGARAQSGPPVYTHDGGNQDGFATPLPRFVCPFPHCTSRSWSSRPQLLIHLENRHLAQNDSISPQFLATIQRQVCVTCKLLVPINTGCRRCNNFLHFVPGSPEHPASADIDESELTRRSEVLFSCPTTLRHVPRGALDDVVELLSFLLQKCVALRSIETALDLLLMPGYVLQPLPRGGAKHGRDSARVVRARVAEWFDKSSSCIRCHPQGRDEAGKRQNDKKEDKRKLVLRTVGEMALSKACRLLTSSDERPDPQTLQDKLNALFPPCTDPATQASPVLSDVDVDEESVVKAIRSFPPDSGGGPSGLRPAHLKEMLASTKKDKLMVALSDFCACLVNGGFPTGVTSLLSAAKLYALKKKNGGIRPIACGDVLRRIAAKCLLQGTLGEYTETLLPLQMGVNVANATEHIMRDISDWTAAHPAGDLLLQVDLTNAFNCVDRQHMLREVLRLTPALYPYAFAFYGQRSRMCGLPFPVWCEQGVQQGDVCGPVFFSVAIHSIISENQARFPVWSRWFLDDGHIRGSPSVLNASLAFLQAEFSRCSLAVNLNKCKLFGDPLTTVPAPLSGIPHQGFSEGVVVLGAPVGSSSFQEQFVKEKLTAMSQFFADVSTLDNVHSEMLILRACGGACQINYLMRVLPYSLGHMLADEVWNDLRTSLERILARSCSPTQLELACLPVREGGLGFRNPLHDHEGALLASLFLHLRESNCTIAQAVADGEISRCRSVLRTQHAIKCQSLESIFRSPLDAPVAGYISPEMASQKWWNGLILSSRLSQWDSAADARLALTRASSAVSTVDPLGCFRNLDSGHPISNHQWRQYARWRLGLNLTSAGGTDACLGCSLSSDILGDHALSCKSLGVYSRHNTVRNALASLCASSGLRVQLEVQAPTTQDRPADILVGGLECEPLALDIAVVHLLPPSSSLAALTTRSPLAQEETRKLQRYDRLHRESGWKFVPVVLNTVGTWGRMGTSFIRHLIKRRALFRGTSFAEEARYCWNYLESAVIFSVSKQLARAFPCEMAIPVEEPMGSHFSVEDTDMDSRVRAPEGPDVRLFTHQPYVSPGAATTHPGEEQPSPAGSRQPQVMSLPEGTVRPLRAPRTQAIIATNASLGLHDPPGPVTLREEERYKPPTHPHVPDACGEEDGMDA